METLKLTFGNCECKMRVDENLPQKIYNYLVLINNIVECDNKNNLAILYNNLKDTLIYNIEIPFES